MSKHQKLDEALLDWMNETQEGLTTNLALDALNIDNSVIRRHISKRFSLLEERGYLKCTRYGSVRTCRVVKPLPEVLSARVVSKYLQSPCRTARPVHTGKSIPAADSEEFIRNGGVIEVIPTSWDHPIQGSIPMGTFYQS